MRHDSLLSLLVYALSIIGLTLGSTVCGQTNNAFHYVGTSYQDSTTGKSLQTIPGKIQCEFYDNGGEGVAYHDMDNKNSGSGALNKGEGYLNTFRIHEAVDISYTKYRDSVDNSPYSIVQPLKDQLYIGWTEPGEWTRYTVDVLETGNYSIGTMYTSNRGGSIMIRINTADSTGILNIPSTYNDKEPLAWRQWHHWNYIDSLATIHLHKGIQVITLTVVSQGNFNFDFLNFKKLE